MNATVLKTNNLTVKYGEYAALDNVSISVQEKHIYGFIGENGAGKTTLMRVFTGLLYPTSGNFEMFGKTNESEILKERRYIGSTIEAPAVYPEYTAWQNLELQRILLGNPDKNVCDELLKLVALENERDKKVRKLSMGMRQRLSIALALIGKPKLLILDEPINGLDPKNISELRLLLKRLNDERDVTIFISSHILSELYLLATDFFFIHKGRIIETLTHEQLDQKCRRFISIVTTDLPKCITVLETHLGKVEYTVTGDESLRLYSNIDDPETVSRILAQNNIITKQFTVSEQSLEEYFLHLTEEKS